jgi:hypothetical protein
MVSIAPPLVQAITGCQQLRPSLHRLHGHLFLVFNPVCLALAGPEWILFLNFNRPTSKPTSSFTGAPARIRWYQAHSPHPASTPTCLYADIISSLLAVSGLVWPEAQHTHSTSQTHLVPDEFWRSGSIPVDCYQVRAFATVRRCFKHLEILGIPLTEQTALIMPSLCGVLV